jgi:hypothetical protein
MASGIRCVSGSWSSPIDPSSEAPAALKYRNTAKESFPTRASARSAFSTSSFVWP